MRTQCGPRGPKGEPPANHEALTRSAAGQGLVVAVSTSAPEGIRTPNLLIRSQMLYPLSYGRSPREPGARRRTRAYRTLWAAAESVRRRAGGVRGLSREQLRKVTGARDQSLCPAPSR